MALNTLFTLTFVSNENYPYVSGDVIITYWDDVALEIVTKLNGDIITSGPNLGFPTERIFVEMETRSESYWYDQVNFTIVDAAYSVCTGNDNNVFYFYDVFPYTNRLQQYNHPSCYVGTVCDLVLSSFLQIVNPSTADASNGKITAAATSSYGPVKYDLADTDYASMSNTTGEFTGLAVGTYTVYIKDANGCSITASATLTASAITWPKLYTFDFIGTANAPDFADGDQLIVYYDATTNSIRPFLNGVEMSSGQVLSLPDYTQLFPYQVFQYYTVTDHQYQFCTGNDLTYFQNQLAYPYVIKQVEANSAQCVILVCDIAFVGAPVIVKPTTSTSADGTIQVTATSSAGTVRYSIYNWDYDIIAPPLGNTDGIFSNLTAGFHRFFAKDPNNCTVWIDLNLTAAEGFPDPGDEDPVIGPRLSFQYTDASGIDTKVEVFERDYTGEETILDVAGAEPVQLRLRGENGQRTDAIGYSELTLNLVAKTEAEFDFLFTDEERKFMVKHRKDFGAGLVEVWRGFITPTLFEESLLATPYDISFEATDQLAFLNDFDFVTDANNAIEGDLRLIEIIAICLSRTALDLPIRCAVNLYETTMNQTAADDPLDQAYRNVKTYEGKSCGEILSDILFTFGATVRQWGGYWHIIRFEEMTASYDYREFDKNGTYVSNGSTNPVVEFKQSNQTNRAAFTDQSQVRAGIGSFGKVELTYDLGLKENLVDNGSFEESYEAEYNGNIISEGFKNWTQAINGNLCVLDDVNGNDSPRAAVLQEIQSGNFENTDYLLSAPKSITFNNTDGFEYKFDYYAAGEKGYGTSIPQFVRIKWALILTVGVDNYYLQSDGTWATDAGLEFNALFVTNYNSWNTFKIETLWPNLSTSASTGTWQVKIMPFTFLGHTLPSFDALRAISTVYKDAGYRICVRKNEGDSSNTTNHYYYKGVVSKENESSPNLIRPNDYNQSTNRYQWELEDTVFVSDNSAVGEIGNADASIFDNVTMTFYPENQDAVKETKPARSINVRVKTKFERNVFHGDVPTTISNGKNIYQNYLKLANGTPTVFWARDGRAEQLPLLDLQTKFIMEQYRYPTYKINTSFLTFENFAQSGIYPTFINSFKAYNKYYVPFGMTINDRSGQHDVELIEAVVNDNGTANPFSGGFKQAAFGNGFNIS